jgi:hypothetical protein
MSRATVCAAVAALAAAAPAAGALPAQGELVPGAMLGGVSLGESSVRLAASLGSVHGVCRGCARTTWYFTYRPFDRQGIGVELTRGRVSAVYTLWQPSGWHGPGGLRLGAPDAEVTSSVGPVVPVACGGYRALVADSSSGRTAYYVAGGRLWAFGIFHRGADPCR